MRGKVQIETFGTMTLPEYDEHIRKYAAELGARGRDFPFEHRWRSHNKFYEAHERGFAAALINPAGYSTGQPALVAAISQVGFPPSKCTFRIQPDAAAPLRLPASARAW